MLSTRTERSVPVGAVVLNAGAFIIPIALGQLFGTILKWINPSDVDVSHELAYLRQILIVAFGLIAVSLVVTVIVDIVLSRRRDRFAPMLWLILGVQVAGFAVFAAAQLIERMITGA